MVYNGYTQAELDSLLKLLEELQIPHALHKDEGLIEQTTQGDRGQRRGALNSSYVRVEIPDEVLKTIDPKHYKAFERFHIYPQYLDTPEGLDFNEQGEVSSAPPEPKAPKKPNYFIQVAMLIITAMMIYGAMRSR